MRIAVVHSYYSSQQPSGENVAVDSQVAALRRAGHTVVVISRRTDDQPLGPIYKLRKSASVATGYGASPIEQLNAFGPDVTHVHNLFPNWGTRWMHQWDGPIVTTLHNYRPMCANGTFFRDGQNCTECMDSGPLRAVRHSCYRDSTLATLPLAISNGLTRASRVPLTESDRIVVPSSFAKRLYEQYLLPAGRITVLPNFAERSSASPQTDLPLVRWVFVGRLSAEKGVRELLEHWPEHQALDIIGDGPDRAHLEQTAPAGVRFLGSMSHEEVLARLPSYIGLLFPGRCFEIMPLTVLEAMAVGLPALVLDGSAAAEAVRDEGFGLVVATDADWADGLSAMTSRREELGKKAREVYDTAYSERTWIKRASHLYEELVANR